MFGLVAAIALKGRRFGWPRTRSLALGLCIAVVAPGAAAQEPEPDFSAAVDLPRLEAHVRAHNPEIRAFEQRWRAFLARPAQEGALPDPMINTAYHNEGFERLTQGSADFSFLRFGIEQELPFPGKRALKREVAEHDASRQGGVFRAAVFSVVARLHTAYADYWLAHEAAAVLNRNLELMRKLADTTDARYRVGEGLQQDVVRAQVEVSTLSGRVLEIEQERQSAAAMLNALLNRPATAPLGPPAPVADADLPDFDLAELEEQANDLAPSLEITGHEVSHAEARLALAERNYFPDFVLRADYFNKASLTPEWEVSAGIRVPLYFWQKQANGVREARATASEAHASRRTTRLELASRIRDLFAQATRARQLANLYRTTVIPQAEIAMHSASVSHQAAKVDFLTVLNSFTVLNEYQLRLLEERARLSKATAQLEEVAGLFDEPDVEDSAAERQSETPGGSR